MKNMPEGEFKHATYDRLTRTNAILLLVDHQVGLVAGPRYPNRKTSERTSLDSSSSKEYRCSICGRIFDSIETLDSHKRLDHSQKGYHPPAGIG